MTLQSYTVFYAGVMNIFIFNLHIRGVEVNSKKNPKMHKSLFQVICQRLITQLLRVRCNKH